MGATVTLTTAADLPGQNIDVAAVSEQAKTLRTVGTGLENGTSDVLSAWQRLPSSYASTGADAVYTAMVPVGRDGTSIAASLSQAAAALDAYVSDVQPILRRIQALAQDIGEFQTTTIPSYPKKGLGTGYEGNYAVADSATVQYDSWDQDPHAVEANHALAVRAQALTADLLQVQQTCATAIRAAAGLQAVGAKEVAAAEKALRATDFHWNAQKAVENNEEGCAGSTNRALNGIFYDGVLVNGVWGTVQSLGGLIGWDGDTTWSWDQAGQSWLGLAHLATGLAMIGPIGAISIPAIEGNKNAPGWMRDWERDSVGSVLGLTGLVGVSLPTKWWDADAWSKNDYFTAWEDDGWQTLGASAFNVGTLFTGVGAVSKIGDAVKLGRGATFADAVADGSIDSLRGLTADELRAAVKGLSAADAEKLAAELAKPELDTSALSGLKLDDLRIHGSGAPEDVPAAADHGDGTPAAHPREDPAASRPADSPDSSAGDTPSHEAPAVETPAHDAPAHDAPTDETPAQETPAQETPAHDAPAHDAPSHEAPATPADAAPKPEFTPRDHDYGPHTQPLKDPADRFDPGTTRSTKLGRIGEALTRQDLADRGFTVIREQLQILIPDGGGKWFKPDFLAVDPSGKLVLIESKMGEGARFTPGQIAGYERFDAGSLKFEPLSAKIGPEVLRRLDALKIDRVIDRVEVYRWNVDIVPDAELAKLVPTVR